MLKIYFDHLLSSRANARNRGVLIAGNRSLSCSATTTTATKRPPFKEMSTNMPRPPQLKTPPTTDRGWAWVVAGAVFFERFFTVGITRSSGLFLLRLVQRYHVTNLYAGTAITLALSIFAVGAPVSTVLGEPLTPRRLVILGGLFGVGAMTVCGLVEHLPSTVLMMGLAIGVVNSCSYGNGMVMVGKYFREKRQIATNFALMGASVGQLVLPPVVEFLIVTYGLRGALLISGALYLQCAVAGSLLRPIHVCYPRFRDERQSRERASNDVVCYTRFRDERKRERASKSKSREEESSWGDGTISDKGSATRLDFDDHSNSDVSQGRPQNGGIMYKKLKSEELGNTVASTIYSSQSVQERPVTPVRQHYEENSPSSAVELELPMVQQVQQPNQCTIPEIVIQTDRDELFSLTPTDDWRNNALYGGNRVNSRLTTESSRRKSEDNNSNSNSNGNSSAAGKAKTGSGSLKNGRRASFSGSVDSCIFTSATTASTIFPGGAVDLYLSDSFDDNDDDDDDDDVSLREGNYDRARRKSSVRSTKSLHSHNSSPRPKLKPASRWNWMSFVRLVFDFSVLKSRTTLLFISVTFLFYSVWYNFVLLLPGIASAKGVTGFDASVVVSMMGLGELATRVAIATGSTIHCNYFYNRFGVTFQFQRYKLKAVAAFLGGVTVVLFIPASSFPQLAICSFFLGLFGGAFECLFPGVLTDFVGGEKTAQTLGVALLFQGTGGAIGQPILGCLSDVTESFHGACAVCSGCLLVSCCLLLMFPLVRGRH